jgi:hypothetical protein
MVNYGFSSYYWAISAVIIGFVYLYLNMRSDRNEIREDPENLTSTSLIMKMPKYESEATQDFLCCYY